MANADRPSGFIPVRHLDGSPFNGMVRMYLCQASDAIFVGDPVVSNGSSGAAAVFVNGINCEGMPDVNRAAAGGAVLGVCVGFLPLESNLAILYKEANSTKRIALVVDSPDVVYEVQDDGSATIAVTAVGNNFDMATWAAGNTTSGVSVTELNASDSSGTNTATYRLLGLVNRPDNALGVNAKWEVMINEHERKQTTGT